VVKRELQLQVLEVVGREVDLLSVLGLLELGLVGLGFLWLQPALVVVVRQHQL